MLHSCKETSRLLSQGEDRRLAFGERLGLRLHLALCDGCRSLSDQFKFLRLAVKNVVQDEIENRHS